jgi:hypothetical protein
LTTGLDVETSEMDFSWPFRAEVTPNRCLSQFNRLGCVKRHSKITELCGRACSWNKTRNAGKPLKVQGGTHIASWLIIA